MLERERCFRELTFVRTTSFRRENCYPVPQLRKGFDVRAETFVVTALNDLGVAIDLTPRLQTLEKGHIGAGYAWLRATAGLLTSYSARSSRFVDIYQTMPRT